MTDTVSDTAPDTVTRPAQTPAISNEDKTWGGLAHLASLVNLLGVPSPLGPLVVWLVKRNDSEFAAQEAKESLNFALSVWLYGAAFIVLAIVFVLSGQIVLAVALGGVWLLLLLGSLVFSIVGGVKASGGEPYVYPFNIRLIE